MSEKLSKRTIPGSKKQELTMRDVLGGLEEIATVLSYNPWPGDFEIVAIYPPKDENTSQQEKTVIKSTPMRPKAQIISYQDRKNQLLKLSA